MERMDSVHNLHVKWSISIGTMTFFGGAGNGHGDGDGDEDGTCKQALTSDVCVLLVMWEGDTTERRMSNVITVYYLMWFHLFISSTDIFNRNLSVSTGGGFCAR